MTTNHRDNNNLLHIIQTPKFKTTTLTVKFIAPLEEETITSRALLSKVLVRATNQWPTDKAFNRYLSNLYGAYVNSHVTKFKNNHVISISLEIVNERYLKDQTPLVEKGIELLAEIITNPLLEGQAFNSNFVTQEKSLLKKKLEAVVDNKPQYSFLKLLQHMFGNHPYRHLSSGRLEDISDITPKSLYHTYMSMLENDYCVAYVVGNVDKTNVTQLFNKHIHINKRQLNTSVAEPLKERHDKPCYVVERDDVDQAKVNLGFTFPTRFGHKDYYSMIVLNMIYGGDPSSVLFNELREKQSLAYSIHSQIDAKNGYMFVLSGVSSAKYNQAKKTIIGEFEKLQRGEFSDTQLELAKKVLISQRNESQDRPKSMIEILNNSILLDEPLTHDAFVKGVNSVTKEEVINLALETQLDTVYILAQEEGGEV
ncbi:insulinase family protein [Staphylococcus sp. SQ8-PEA]|uniref:Insulinase family protein n=1 Tax=Staphylococcus marylandisciuri TaxID=2981529 RepID=A0ABT2QS07_9STAP|nr:pitrilysin family protein [Staphylococcus marylandisciuri]MCU5746758.1 insulinase family protein [Staphylococcus marylandisciuri]